LFREEQGLALDGLIQPTALYNWYYRPDYQFSVVDLAMNSINLVGEDEETGEPVNTNIITESNPKITGTSIVDLIYSISGSDQTRLPSLDGENYQDW
jgi:hypothetical protein